LIPITAVGLLDHTLFSESELTWFIRYIYLSNLQFINNLMYLKNKVGFPQA